MAFVSGVILASLACTATAETIHGALVYSRHGDRTTKHYGAQALTSLGAHQNFQVGADYRARYLASNSPEKILGISEFAYVPAQVYASAPNQGILLNTATAFLQGFYPPLAGLDAEVATTSLNNGSTSTSPLDGYQYVLIHGESDNSPDTIWIKGDDACPTITKASKSFESSTEFKTRVENTRDFYRKFYNILDDVYDYTSLDNMTYAKAYDIFDLINVARIHNSTSPARNVSDEDLFQLRTLADSSEFGLNFNKSQPERAIHGQTLAAAIVAQLNQTVTSKGKVKFSLLAGSYDTFMAFFGLVGLPDLNTDFYGLPDYASTMAFELVSDDATAFPATPNTELRVRFLFRNSTYGQLIPYPLFGTGKDTLTWAEFVGRMTENAITTVGEWCNVCQSKADFCAAYRDGADAGASSNGSSGGGDMSNAVAGVIGAMVTLGVALIVGLVTSLLFRKRRSSATAVPVMSEQGSGKGSFSSAGQENNI